MNRPVNLRPPGRPPAPSTAVELAGPRSQLEIDMQVAEALASSDLVPADYRGKPANVLVSIGLGRALGMEPAVALYSMHVIEGTPSPTAKAQAALVRRAGHRLRVLASDDTHSHVQIVRADDPDYPVEVDYTVDDAGRQGLLDLWCERWVDAPGGRKRKEKWRFPPDLPPDAGPDAREAAGAPQWAHRAPVKRNDPWWTVRRTMLHHRAVTAAVAMACPEVVSGLELEPTAWADYHDDGTDVVDVVDTLTPNPQPPVESDPPASAVDSQSPDPVESSGASPAAPDNGEAPGPDDPPPGPELLEAVAVHDLATVELVRSLPAREVLNRLRAAGADLAGTLEELQDRLLAVMATTEPFEVDQ